MHVGNRSVVVMKLQQDISKVYELMRMGMPVDRVTVAPLHANKLSGAHHDLLQLTKTCVCHFLSCISLKKKKNSPSSVVFFRTN